MSFCVPLLYGRGSEGSRFGRAGFGAAILRGIGSLLQKDGPPVAADIIVVLSGDGSGNRVLKGAELARDGLAPAVLVSNGGSRYSRTDSQLAIEFAIRQGYSPDLFIETNWSAFSTAEEAQHVIAMLRSRGVQRVIVVTSPWHTARAGRIYRRLAPELTFYPVGSEDAHWRRMDREGRKAFFLECAKTIAGFLGI